jgi:hypothetical protein
MKGMVFAWVLLAGWLVASGPARAAVTIARLEVTQGVQTPANDVPLVAGRSTTVRAFLDRGGDNGLVRGVLRGEIDGTEITPAGGLSASNEPFDPPASPSRDRQADSLNFDLGALGQWGHAGRTARFTVELRPGGAASATKDFVLVRPLRPAIYHVGIRYDPDPSHPAAPAPADLSRARDMCLALIPVADTDPWLSLDGGEMSYSFSADTDQVLNKYDEYEELLLNLEWWRNDIVDEGADPGATFVYGWTDCFVKCNGYARMPGRAGFGNTDPSRFQRTFAHELCHMFSLDHPPSDVHTTEVGWDVLGRLGGDRARPADLFDIMVPGKTTSQAWIDRGMYERLQGVSFSDGVGVGMQDDVLLVQGTIEGTGGQLSARLRPAFRLPWKRRPASVEAPGQFMARVIDPDGKIVVERRFEAWNASAGAEGGEGERRLGAFSVLAPLPGGVRAARVEVLEGRRPIGSLEGSERSPQVTIFSPLANQKVSGSVQVSWRGEDRDSKELAYQVVFSPDGGKRFVPLRVGLVGGAGEKGASIVFESARVPRGNGPALLRVLASDGLNTTYADVRFVLAP